MLREIDKDTSCKILIDTLLDEKQHPEIRAGKFVSLKRHQYLCTACKLVVDDRDFHNLREDGVRLSGLF